MKNLKCWIISIIVAGSLLFGMHNFVNWVIDQDKKFRDKNAQAATYIIKCIEGGKNAEDCKTLGQLKYFGVH